MKLRLPNGVASLKDLTDIQLELREYARWFAHESIKKRVNVKHSVDPPALSTEAKELIHTISAHEPISSDSLDELIKTLEEYKNTAPTITFTVAATPNSVVKNNLVNWCRINVSPNILVTFQFNSTILGGAVIRIGSKVYDWSFKRQILAARQQFPEVLRRV